MRKEILKYKRVLYNLPVAQNVETLFSIHADVKPQIVNVPQLQMVFGNFEREQLAFDGFYKQRSKAFETEDIVQKDARRDFTLRAVIAKVDYCYDFALSDEEREEARRLLYIVEKYRKVVQIEYQAETASIRSMVSELEQVPELLATFGLTALTARLKQENEDFETLYNSRAQTVYDKHQKGNTTKYRSSANGTFDDFCAVLQSIQLTPLSESERAAVESIIDIVNGHIRQATIVYNRHVGIVSARKQGESSGESGGSSAEENVTAE